MPAEQQLVIADPVIEAARKPEPSESSALMRIIERAAFDPQFDAAKLSALLDVKERWEAAEAKKAFTAAMKTLPPLPRIGTSNFRRRPA
jgi:hypothetical protein